MNTQKENNKNKKIKKSLSRFFKKKNIEKKDLSEKSIENTIQCLAQVQKVKNGPIKDDFESFNEAWLKILKGFLALKEKTCTLKSEEMTVDEATAQTELNALEYMIFEKIFSTQIAGEGLKGFCKVLTSSGYTKYLNLPEIEDIDLKLATLIKQTSNFSLVNFVKNSQSSFNSFNAFDVFLEPDEKDNVMLCYELINATYNFSKQSNDDNQFLLEQINKILKKPFFSESQILKQQREHLAKEIHYQVMNQFIDRCFVSNDGEEIIDFYGKVFINHLKTDPIAISSEAQKIFKNREERKGEEPSEVTRFFKNFEKTMLLEAVRLLGEDKNVNDSEEINDFYHKIQPLIDDLKKDPANISSKIQKIFKKRKEREKKEPAEMTQFFKDFEKTIMLQAFFLLCENKNVNEEKLIPYCSRILLEYYEKSSSEIQNILDTAKKNHPDKIKCFEQAEKMFLLGQFCTLCCDATDETKPLDFYDTVLSKYLEMHEEVRSEIQDFLKKCKKELPNKTSMLEKIEQHIFPEPPTPSYGKK